MLKKLRRKFMWVSTLVLVAVIVAVMGIVYWITSSAIMTETRILMEEILENDGNLPGQGEFNPRQDPFTALNQESIYETRYFTALVGNSDTRITHINIAMKEDAAKDIAEKVYKKNSDYGSTSMLGGRRLNYMKKTRTDGSTLIVLLDTTSRFSLIHRIMMFLSMLWLAVVVLYILIMGRYSKKLLRPFVENDERQKRFITNASHELKTPLAVISSNTEMTEALTGRTKWTESTMRQVTRLRDLIENLVVLSRLDEMQEPRLSDIDLSAAVTETVEPFRSLIEASGKQLIIDVDPGVKSRSEKRSFTQILSILMDNAVKYCDEGGQIVVSLKGKKLSVSNTYADGKDVDYSRFFERFYREDESHNSAKAGFGIGLSMAKEMAERLGGTIKVTYSCDMISFNVELI
ncbi:MAG: HAMP domain-containing histidine kinase [Lachnospiraceae bacterium]|nr:HAMP domain-containing histidine kinase [Lachnospiraceae bacterium]